MEMRGLGGAGNQRFKLEVRMPLGSSHTAPGNCGFFLLAEGTPLLKKLNSITTKVSPHSSSETQLPALVPSSSLCLPGALPDPAHLLWAPGSQACCLSNPLQLRCVSKEGAT